MDIITASGEIVSFSREADGDTFDGAVVGLGALGVVARLSLDLEPSYQVRQNVYVDLPYDVLAAEFDAIFEAGKSVSIFTDWRGDTASSVWVKAMITDTSSVPPADFFGAVPAIRPMHPLPGGASDDCTKQLGVPGPWHERLPHFRMEFSPSNGDEIQAEFFMPREEASKAISAMRAHGDRLAPILLASEIRTIAADNLWLSPGLHGPYFGFHFTFRRDWEAIRWVLPAIEADLGALGAVPHWGKVTTMAPSTIRSRFSRLADFRGLAMSYDPRGKFRNNFLDLYVFEAQ